mgnify:FL=1
MPLRPEKKRADISIMVAVFCVAFLAFCAFGIDMAYITLNRVKLQRAVETTALASVARYKDSLVDESEELFNLYKSKFDTTKDAQLVSSEYKDEGSGIFKVKISAKLMSPTYFLRFAGVGGVRIEANSYAQTTQQVEKDKKSGDIITLNNIMTDKKGSEFKIKTKEGSWGYFIFAGTKDKNNNYIWSDIGCKADSATTLRTVGTKNYHLICANETKFDLSKSCTPKIDTNVAGYLRIFSANATDCTALSDIEDTIKDKIENEINDKKPLIDEQWEQNFPKNNPETGEPIPWDKLEMPLPPGFPITMEWVNSLMPAQDPNPYEITILNNVKLITKDDF